MRFLPPYYEGLLLRIVDHNGFFSEDKFSVSITDAANFDQWMF